MPERGMLTPIARLLGLGDEMRVQNPKLQQTAGRNPRWYIRPYVKRLYPDGKTRSQKERIYLGLCSEMGKRQAIAEKNRVLGTVNRERYVVQAQLRFGEFLDHYEKAYVRSEHNLAVSTQAKYLSHIANHLRPAFGDLMMAEVDARRIDAFLAEKAKSAGIDKDGNARLGLSWAARMDLRNLLSGMFTQAHRWGMWNERNPAEDAIVGRKRAVRERHNINDQSIRELFAALPEDVRSILEMGLFYTLSVSEILGLQERHLDFSANLIRVQQRYYRGDLDVTKNAFRVRDIPMGAMIGALRQRCTGDPDRFVFSVLTKFGESRDDRDINQHFLRPAAKALGIYWPGFGFHQFRRQAITALGVDPLQAKKLAGHSHVDMTGAYTLDDRDRQERLIRDHQERILGVVPIRRKSVENRPKRAKKIGNAG